MTHALAAARLLTRRGMHYTAIAAGTVNGRPTPGKPLGYLPFSSTRETNQSGMVFEASVLRKLGPFDESLFIDCVDTDYILRGAVTGRPTVLAPACAMEHSVGDGIPVRLPLPFRRRDRTVSYHGPLRRYYIARNRARLLVRFAATRPSWAVIQTTEQAKLALADLVYGPQPASQARASLLGWWDGIRRHGGRIDDRRVRQIEGSGA